MYSILEIKFTFLIFIFKKGFGICKELYSVILILGIFFDDWIVFIIFLDVSMFDFWLRWIFMCDLIDVVFLLYGFLLFCGLEKFMRFIDIL